MTLAGRIRAFVTKLRPARPHYSKVAFVDSMSKVPDEIRDNDLHRRHGKIREVGALRVSLRAEASARRTAHEECIAALDAPSETRPCIAVAVGERR